ncbi:endolytic transglycosylase MltG [Sinimarinibacterium sp. NLF-5-8]|uniref:endolytic transglycosylase MltG n=1 Tax=Sinimarinibacterium sp. NLF-5-8 TaxID=2698684 RepID=UPI00137B96E9|nr:endolytic transglycosylase MltG [Sinimarinibacterium sp. NLF-5-8]QHS09489.1 endolytic transglycosylase MltG [Sinimarinibacterium sp. NLF-5-8]
MRFLIRLIAVLALVAGALSWDFARVLQTPLQLDEGATLSVPDGTGFVRLTHSLADHGWLAHAPRSLWYLRAYARWQGLDTRIKAGEYRLPVGTTPVQAVALIVSGQAIVQTLRLTEGWTFAQALAQVRAHPALKQTLPVDADPTTVMRAISDGFPPVQGEPEGWLFPDTYHFARGITDVAFLKRALTTMQAVLAQEWEGRADHLPYDSPEQALVMASIIEKETGIADERAQIAGVFVRRLNLGMRLQTDPTVIYGMGARYNGTIRKADLLADTPYNTYTRDGLPPTPICLPSRAAIHAALHPAPGKALYFVSRGDGSHVFSETLAQHNAAVRQYILNKK